MERTSIAAEREKVSATGKRGNARLRIQALHRGRSKGPKSKSETKVMDRVKKTENRGRGRRINMTTVIKDRKDKDSM